MRSHHLAALLAVAAAAGACHPKSLKEAGREQFGGGLHLATTEPLKRPVTVAERLDCPDREGRLSRTAAAPDGRSCSYASDEQEVQLLRLDAGADGPAALLAPMRAEADALFPRQRDHASLTVVSERGPDGQMVKRVDMPFLHVRKEGGVADVKMLGLHIHKKHDRDSDDEWDEKPASSPASPTGVDYAYMLAGDSAAARGYHAAGYVARSDAEGRTVVASFKSKRFKHREEEHGDEHDDPDVQALLDLNARKG